MNKDRDQQAENSPENSDNNSEKKKQDLKKRLKQYALRIIRLYESLPKHGAVHVISHQLVRSGTSPGAHYSEACRAKSNADFISKIKADCKNLKKVFIGWNYLSKVNLLPKRN